LLFDRERTMRLGERDLEPILHGMAYSCKPAHRRLHSSKQCKACAVIDRVKHAQ
jgi:hypothetical protein